LRPSGPDPLLALVHDLFGRARPIECVRRADFPFYDPGERHHGGEICLRMARSHDLEDLQPALSSNPPADEVSDSDFSVSPPISAFIVRVHRKR
jgi:hypothetical protein